MNLRERWESQQPIARIAFFGLNGPEDDPVYAFQATGSNMLSLAVDRRGHLASVAITIARLVYMTDINPRQAGGLDADARVFLDGDMSLDIVTSTLRQLPDHVFPGAYQVMADKNGSRVRALISQTSVREIVPLNEPADDFVFVSVPADRSSELWPELGHKR